MLNWVILIMLASTIYAEEKAKFVPTVGDQAFQFSIENNFTLGEFNGSMISYKRILKDNKALQLGFSFNGNFADDESDTRYDHFYADTTIVDYDDGEVEVDNMGAEINLFLISAKVGKFSRSYFGYGPFIRYSNYSYKSFILREDESSYSRLNEADSWEIGLSGLFGIEWALNSFMTLHADYRSSIAFSKLQEDMTYTDYMDDERINRGKRIEKSKSYSLISEGVRFGLSVYF
jgi:hypothetical protein